MKLCASNGGLAMKQKICLDCPTIVTSKATRCEPCRAERKKQTRNAFMAAQRESYRGMKAIAPVKVTRAETVKTSAQVDAECRKEEVRLAAIRPQLNQEMLRERLMRKACVSALY